MKELTKGQIDRAKPEATDRWLWDGKMSGFGLRVWPTGRKVFMYVYRPKGGGRAASKRKVTIGTYGSITVEQARKEATKLAGLVAAGHDPASERDAKRRELHAASTVAELVALFLADRRAKKKETTVDEYERFLTRDVLPRLGRHKVGNVTRTEVASLHRGMSDRPYLANRVLAVLHAVFTFAAVHGMVPAGGNPCTGIEPYTEKPRERFLSEAEFAALGVALARAEREGLPVPEKLKGRKRGVSRKRQAKSTGRKRRPYKRVAPPPSPTPANPLAVAAIRLLLLSGWREKEALTLRWDYLDEQRGLVTLPETKTGRNVRQLGAAAWQLLSDLPRRADSPYVFPGRKKGEPLKEINRVWEAVRHAAGLANVRLHDLRHSHASIGAGDLGLSLPTIGALLGHTEVATTQRYAHLAAHPMRRAADAVANRVAELLAGGETTPGGDTPSNVLPFARRA